MSADTIQNGDRVRDVLTGQEGVYQWGRFSGEPSILWDDDPRPEFYYEGELEKLPPRT